MRIQIRGPIRNIFDHVFESYAPVSSLSMVSGAGFNDCGYETADAVWSHENCVGHGWAADREANDALGCGHVVGYTASISNYVLVARNERLHLGTDYRPP